MDLDVFMDPREDGYFPKSDKNPAYPCHECVSNQRGKSFRVYTFEHEGLGIISLWIWNSKHVMLRTRNYEVLALVCS